MSDERSASISADEILAAVGLALVATDASGVVVFWNQAAEKLYGWSAEEAVGRQIEELTTPQVGHQAAEEMAAALCDGSPWSGGFPMSQKDGTVFPALVTDRGIYRDGKLVGLVGLTSNLGTAVRPLLERSPDAALVLRADAVVTYASPSAGLLFGAEASVLGASVLPLLHPDERQLLTRAMNEVDVGGVRPAVEVRVQTGTGWAWVEAVLTNMLDDAQVRGVVCSLRRSRRREAHQATEQQVEQLTTALQSRILIEQAKGFLTGRYGMAPKVGFAWLRGYARDHNMRIHEVARQVLAGAIVQSMN